MIPNHEFDMLTHIGSRAEKVPEDATTSTETCLVGLCTGLFAAAAVACSPSLSALVHIAVQVTIMAFRTGSYVAALGDKLSDTSDNAEPWTYVVPGVTEALATSTLRNFHEAKVGTHLTSFSKR